MTTRILLSFALGVLFAAPGIATAEKFAKQSIDMQTVPVPLRQAQEAKRDAPSAPSLSVEEFLGLKQARIQTINGRQITYLRRIIGLADTDDPQLPDYYFRLGELFAERYRTLNNLAHGLDERIFRAEHATPSVKEVHRGIQ